MTHTAGPPASTTPHELYVPTVLGGIAASDLGRTNMHEHLLMRDPMLLGDELDDVERSAAETMQLRRTGFDAVLELTPIGLGRDPQGLAAISRMTGLYIVMATGVHHEDHYEPDHQVRLMDADQLERQFTTELLDGVGTTGVKAGVIKVGTGYWRISPFERRALEAAAGAYLATGAPIVCHLERGTAGFEVLEALGRAGVPGDRVLLAHLDRNPDPELHAELAAAGAFVGYDGWGRAKYWPDSSLLNCLFAAIQLGAADRIVLGGDVARRSSFRSYGGLPGLAYLGERVLPRIRAGGGDAFVDRLLIENPRRLLGRGQSAGASSRPETVRFPTQERSLHHANMISLDTQGPS